MVKTIRIGQSAGKIVYVYCRISDEEVFFILVENQICRIRVNASSINYYRNKGYVVGMNQYADIKAEDLTHSSKTPVKVQCDYCGKVFEKHFEKYYKQREIVNKDACFDCFPLKQKDVCQAKYGVDTTMQLEDVKSKSLDTINHRYGVDNVMQSEEIHNRFITTMLENYGVAYAQQDENIKLKTRNTLIQKYGVDHTMGIDEVKNKVNTFEYVNSKKVSRSQRRIAEFLNGDLNLNIEGYFADIVLNEDRLIIEYDGSGHDLAVRFNKISQTEFDNKEQRKFSAFTQNNWRYIIIKNPTEKYINKNRLAEILNIVTEMKNNKYDSAILQI